MSITIQDAISARHGDNFHGLSANGTKTINVRVSGACKTWKTRPGEFKLPVKYGMYGSGYITHEDVARWTKGRASV